MTDYLIQYGRENLFVTFKIYLVIERGTFQTTLRYQNQMLLNDSISNVEFYQIMIKLDAAEMGS